MESHLMAREPIPDGCVCAAMGWWPGMEPLRVCGQYCRPLRKGEPQCDECGHHIKCHAPEASGEAKSTMSDPICIHCGERESEHHAFEAWPMPAGCVCRPGDWFVKNVPAVCGAFAQDREANDACCLHCKHERACHPGEQA